MRTTAAAALAVYERAMRLRGRSPATVATNLYTARRFLATVRLPVLRLRRADVARYLAALRTAGIAGTTQARVLTTLRAFFAALVEAELIARSPTDGLVVAPSEPRSPLVLTEAAVAKLLAATEVRPRSGVSPALLLRDRALLELLYGLGLRSSEARAALVTDLNVADGTLIVRAAKRGQWRTLPLPPAALAQLRRYLEEARPKLVRRGQDQEHLIVSKAGTPLRTRTDVHRIVAKLARRADVVCHPHALRRALATHLVASNVNVRAVQILLGHSDLGVTERYVAIDRAKLRDAVGVLDRAAVRR